MSVDPSVQSAEPLRFRQATAPIVAILQELCVAIKSMASGHGHLPSANCPAMSDLAAEISMRLKLSLWETAMQDTHTFGGMTLFAGADYGSSFASLIDADEPPVYGHLVVARAAMEASVISAWLCDPTITPIDRLRRGLMEQMYNTKEVKRLKLPGIDFEGQSARWKAVADAFGWEVRWSNGKPIVDGATWPSIPDGISRLLARSTQVNVGKFQWSYPSAVSHVTWYGLRQSLMDGEGGSAAMPHVVSVGTGLESVRSQAVCVLRALRNAADARASLMGWLTPAWVELADHVKEVEIGLLVANQNVQKAREEGETGGQP